MIKILVGFFAVALVVLILWLMAHLIKIFIERGLTKEEIDERGRPFYGYFNRIIHISELMVLCAAVATVVCSILYFIGSLIV